MRILILLTVGLMSFMSHAEDPDAVLAKAASGTAGDLDKAFAILAHSAGGDADDADSAIAKSIAGHPRNFLAAAKKAKMAKGNLEELVTNTTNDLVDNFKGQREELEARLKAIESVKDPSLENLRRRAEMALKAEIKKRAHMGED